MCVVWWLVLNREVSSAEINGNLSLRLYKVSPFPAQPNGEGKRVLVRAKFIKSKFSEGISEFSWRRTERNNSHLTCLILFLPKNQLPLHFLIRNGEGIQFHFFIFSVFNRWLFVLETFKRALTWATWYQHLFPKDLIPLFEEKWNGKWPSKHDRILNHFT